MFAPFHHEHPNRGLAQYVIELLPKNHVELQF